MKLSEKFHTLGLEVKDELIQIRRHLHSNPELSFQEFNTSAFIQEVLKKWGIVYTNGWAGTGIVGEIYSRAQSDRRVALRADIDALPIQEENQLEFCSKNPGVMHACGHDVHTTCLLGAIYILNNTKDDWSGIVKFIFQPGEEKLPGGASILLKENVFGNTKPSLIIGQHVQPNMEVGTIGICSGKAMASCDEIYITVTGKGGHAAMPQLANNPIPIASELILRLNNLIKEKLPSDQKAILSFGKINTLGGATNIIPETIKIEGTFRCLNEEFRYNFHEELKKSVRILESQTSSDICLNIDIGYPCLKNDESLCEQFIQKLGGFPGVSKIEILPPRLTSEDFSYYSQELPAIFYRLGTGVSTNVHTPQFVVNEDSISLGASIMAYLAVELDSIT